MSQSPFADQVTYSERIAHLLSEAIDAHWERVFVEAEVGEQLVQLTAGYIVAGEAEPRDVGYVDDLDSVFKELATSLQTRGFGRPRAFRFLLTADGKYDLQTDYGDGFPA